MSPLCIYMYYTLYCRDIRNIVHDLVANANVRKLESFSLFLA